MMKLHGQVGISALDALVQPEAAGLVRVTDPAPAGKPSEPSKGSHARASLIVEGRDLSARDDNGSDRREEGHERPNERDGRDEGGRAGLATQAEDDAGVDGEDQRPQCGGDVAGLNQNTLCGAQRRRGAGDGETTESDPVQRQREAGALFDQ